MQVIDWADFVEKGLPSLKKTAMTVGVFDGVHRGHQALIQRIVSHNAKSADLTPVIITFRENYKNGKSEENIQTFAQKLEVFNQLGTEITIAIDFTESFRQMRGLEFLQILLKRGNIGFFTIGKGFRCGYQLDTDASAIAAFFALHKIEVEIAGEIMEGGLPVSSSRIRAAIADGDLKLANAMLGREIKS